MTEGNSRPGFFLPYRHADSVQPRPGPAWMHTLFDSALPETRQWLDAARGFSARLADFAVETDGQPNVPRFNQDWFAGLDGAMAYTAVRQLAPDRIIEIGSGHSTRFMAQAIRDGALTTHLHSIDPQPRRDIDVLCDQVTRATLSEVDSEIVRDLGRNDILFVDGSHLVMPGTDVEQVFVELVPLLPAGTVIHVHDIFLPDPYPDSWAWRGYNEQSLIGALLGTGQFQVLAANAWLRQYRAELLDGIYCPLHGGFESSLWMAKSG